MQYCKVHLQVWKAVCIVNCYSNWNFPRNMIQFYGFFLTANELFKTINFGDIYLCRLADVALQVREKKYAILSLSISPEQHGNC